MSTSVDTGAEDTLSTIVECGGERVALQYYCGSLDFTRLFDLRRLRFLRKISVCRKVALKECFYRTDVDYLCYEYNVNFSLSLSVINRSVYRKFGDICGMF